MSYLDDFTMHVQTMLNACMLHLQYYVKMVCIALWTVASLVAKVGLPGTVAMFSYPYVGLLVPVQIILIFILEYYICFIHISEFDLYCYSRGTMRQQLRLDHDEVIGRNISTKLKIKYSYFARISISTCKKILIVVVKRSFAV